MGSNVQVEPPGKVDSIAAVGPEYLRTDHLTENIGKHAVLGGVVTGGAQAAKFVLNLISAVVLARLLGPKDFGLVGMVLAVTTLLGLLKDLGLSTATVQREIITEDQVSNLFWINVTLSGVIATLSLALAPVVARFYHDPRLIPIMLTLSVTFLLSGSTVQHQALLTRQMRFRALAIIDVTSMLAGILTAFALALLGFGYWALVGQQMCLTAAGLVLTWWISGWRPTLPRRNSGVRPLLRFGAQLTLSDVVGRISATADSILIGRYCGAEPLGLYSRASVLLTRPLQQVLIPITSVMIPVLSRLQSDPVRYKRTFLRAYDILALITFPFAALCLVLSEPLVLLLLGPRWKPAAPLFAAFTLVAISLPLSLTPSWLCMSQGRGRTLFNAYSIGGAITVAAYIVGLRWGPLGVVLASAAAGIGLRLPLYYYLGGQQGPVGARDLWKGFLAYLPCWAGVYIPTAFAHRMLSHAAPFVQVLVCVPVGLVAAAAISLSLSRPRASALHAWSAASGLVWRQRSSRRKSRS
ncbi:MAG TPA: lipopolysaccharide biosynthesis protein [Candidatus Angelobacter sp.]|nr:lipopolysaccharide biosynthesis protein [Candidatus Angelobacter sp.]